ncbi:MAG: OmpA family protein [Desulfovibrionaceae bacterium]|nr:OmpA family protein [Desulfovibrionaceae bacterium]
MRLLKSFVLAAAFMLAISTTAQAQQLCPNPTAKVDSFDFLVDYSGSMMMHYSDGNVAGPVKMDMAKSIMETVNSKLAPISYTAGIHTFSPFEEILPAGPYNKDLFAAAVSTLRSDWDPFYRMTAMGDGLYEYSAVAQAMPGRSAIILVSDGMSNRGTDPVEQARALYAANPNAVIHVVSLADSPEGKAYLDQIAALNPNTVYVSGFEILNDEQAMNQFINDVFYTCGEVIVLRSVQFAFDSAALDATAKGILNEAASMLKDQSGTIYVDGHTCDLGSEQYNQRLSERRANSVRDYLIAKGIAADRLIARGFGESNPKYSNATEETRRLNRRVELNVE